MQAQRTIVNRNLSTHELVLDNLLISCRADVKRGRGSIVGLHYTDEGITMIVNDYLRWAQHYETTADPEVYNQVVSEMKSLIPVQPDTTVKN